MTSQDDILSLPPKVTKYFRNKTKVPSVCEQSALKITELGLCITMPSSFLSAPSSGILSLFWGMFLSTSSNIPMLAWREWVRPPGLILNEFCHSKVI